MTGLTPGRTAALVVTGVALTVVLGYQTIASPTSSATSSATSSDSAAHDHRRVGRADGVVPDGTTVFDDELPAVARLDPALREALRAAARAAAGDGVEIVVNSGWRSRAYQEQLLDDLERTRLAGLLEKWGRALGA